MSAVIASQVPVIPRGATALERWALRRAIAVTGWITRRAEIRQERHDALLARLQIEQTTAADPAATDRALAQCGLPLK
ncbi:hypothetical protein [Microbacterium sp. CIAB417]|uniref:hypothetical protein n=1 Tax=Microbacterium sp. CIAB417 TaxID=2860287 RepID=UPI001FADBE64|nr:hypothetical protein [Microbacterium sp. CIAB417]